MAQMIGDGPNRGKSAPPPPRLPKPKAKQADDGPRDREGLRAPAPWKPDSMRPGGSAARLFQNLPLEAPPRKTMVETERRVPERPPALAPRSKQAVQLYNQYQTDADARQNQANAPVLMYQAMADRQRKDEKRLQREKKDRKESAEPMTVDEWNALTPLQQAAVQANADLAGAIARDFKTQSKHTANSSQNPGGTERIRTYMDDVKSLFGEDGSVGFKGLEFAPNTLTFLKERGIDENDLGGRTLDDLVSGDTLFTDEDIAQLAKEQPGQQGGGKDIFSPLPSRPVFVEKIARGQLQYQEDLANKLAKGKELLTNSTGAATNTAAGNLYGAKQDTEAKLEAIQPQTMQQIDVYMEALARPDSPIDKALNAINLDLQQRGVSTVEAEQVFKEMSNRARKGTTGEGNWFDGLDFPMRTPQEVAQALGAPTLKRLYQPRVGG